MIVPVVSANGHPGAGHTASPGAAFNEIPRQDPPDEIHQQHVFIEEIRFPGDHRVVPVFLENTGIVLWDIDIDLWIETRKRTHYFSPGMSILTLGIL